MLTKKQLETLLQIAAKESNSCAIRYGVHRYEHGRHLRPCPESFVVNAVYNHLSQLSYEVTAEANQGGIWKLAKQSRRMPKRSSKRRYDLVIWNGRTKPVALCEFKWGYNPAGFQADAKDLAHAREVLNISPVLCLMTIKENPNKLLSAIDKQVYILEAKYGIRAIVHSAIQRTDQYFCGRKLKNRHAHIQTIACSTK